MVDGAVVSDIQYTAATVRDQGRMEQGQWPQILPVYYSDVVLPA